MTNKSDDGLRLRRPYGALVLVAVAIVLVSLAETQTGQRLLTRIGVIGPSQGYTELAFVGAQHLPTQLLPSSRIHVPFTITNRQGKAMDYTWTIFEVTAAGSKSLLVGETTLKTGQVAQLDPKVIVTCTSSPTRVEVRLNSGPLVNFIVQCISGAAQPRGGRATYRPSRDRHAVRQRKL